MAKLTSFQEYLNSKGKVTEKPVTALVADKIDMPAQKAQEDPTKNKKKSKLQQVKEYLNEKGKLVEPEVDVVADYKGPDPKAPETPAKGEKPAPYKAPSSSSNQKSKETGFGDLGGKELIYNPNTDTDSKKSPYIPGGKAVDTYPKTKTEEFIEKTKNMSIKEFTQYMLKECNCDEMADLPMVTAYSPGKFHPHPPEAIKYVVALSGKNDRLLEQLVHEMKRNSVLPKLMHTLLGHPESMDELTSFFGDEKEGMKRSNTFAKSMDGAYSSFLDGQDKLYETVGPPLGLEDEEEFDEEEPEDDHGHEGHEEEPDMDTDEEPDQHPDNDEPNNQDTGDEDLPPMPKVKKLKKRFAHDNVLDSMATYDHIKEKMKSY
jgi:hypothetical protein